MLIASVLGAHSRLGPARRQWDRSQQGTVQQVIESTVVHHHHLLVAIGQSNMQINYLLHFCGRNYNSICLTTIAQHSRLKVEKLINFSVKLNIWALSKITPKWIWEKSCQMWSLCGTRQLVNLLEPNSLAIQIGPLAGHLESVSGQFGDDACIGAGILSFAYRSIGLPVCVHRCFAFRALHLSISLTSDGRLAMIVVRSNRCRSNLSKHNLLPAAYTPGITSDTGMDTSALHFAELTHTVHLWAI